jgi:hypothetical protein
MFSFGKNLSEEKATYSFGYALIDDLEEPYPLLIFA